jgi:hypothetical protein
MRTVPKRFTARPDPLRPVLDGTIDMTAAIAAIERHGSAGRST